MRKIYDLLDIHQLKTTAYHPECDGLTERFNRTLKTMIACYVNENQNNWDELLPFLSYAYNTSTHSTTNHSPYEVIFGRKPKIPIDLIIAESAEYNEEGEVTVDLNATETENNYNEKSQVYQYVSELREKFKEVFNCVQTITNSKIEKVKFITNATLSQMNIK